jgi:predicted RNA-binding protein YlqC (UPF0109 family)
MSLVELTETIVKSLVEDKDSVSVKQFEEENNEILIEIVLKEEDKNNLFSDGKMLISIKTLLQASSYLKDNKKVKINVTSY